MKIVNVHEAKTRLSQLIAAAERGEEVVIAKAGKPAVRLTAISREPRKPRKGGFMKAFIGEDFDDPLPAELERAFHGDDT